MPISMLPTTPIHLHVDQIRNLMKALGSLPSGPAPHTVDTHTIEMLARALHRLSPEAS